MQDAVGPIDDVLTVPPRWVDASTSPPDPAWIANSWRAGDAQGRGARAALNQLLHPGHIETYGPLPLDWRSWSAFTAAPADPHLSLACLRNQARGIGHTTPTALR